jgi:hypothetical protein
MTVAVFQPTPRTRVKRLHEKARYDREAVHAILDAGLVCHVGYVIEGQPYVTPTAYWRQGERVYWHGSSASRMLRALKGGIPCCFTVSLLDSLRLARSGFHSSIGYRSVMAYGQCRPVEGEAEKLRVLEDFSERLTPGRWADLRPSSSQEVKATTILWLPLEEAVAKVSGGPPEDDEADYALDVWAGVLPITTCIGAPEPDPRLKPGIAPPDHLAAFRLG